MSNSIVRFGLYAGLVLMLFASAGCVKSKRMVYAEYILPPKAIADVASIEKIEIVSPNVKVSGAGRKTSKAIKNVFSNTIVQDFGSKLYYNGYIRPADEVYHDVEGLKYVRKALAKSRHGYNVKVVKERKPAKLKIYANIKYKRSKGVDRINTTLVTQNYSIEYSDKGVPFTKASSRSQQVVTNKVPYVEVKAEGVLVCSVYNSNGKKIYTRKFDDLEFENKTGGDAGANAEAPYLEVAQSLFNDAISKVILDISPYRESKALVVNEKGDSTAVALIKGTAFFDAKNRLETLIDDAEVEIEKSSAEVCAKYDPMISSAEDEEKRASLVAEKTSELIDTTKYCSPDYENMAIVMEILGDRYDALDYYELAAKADPENESAKGSISRVRELVDASSKLTNPQKIDKYQQGKFQEN